MNPTDASSKKNDITQVKGNMAKPYSIKPISTILKLICTAINKILSLLIFRDFTKTYRCLFHQVKSRRVKFILRKKFNSKQVQLIINVLHVALYIFCFLLIILIDRNVPIFLVSVTFRFPCSFTIIIYLFLIAFFFPSFLVVYQSIFFIHEYLHLRNFLLLIFPPPLSSEFCYPSSFPLCPHLLFIFFSFSSLHPPFKP